MRTEKHHPEKHCPENGAESKRERRDYYVDTRRGVAFFDGLLIEADPITATPRDRVLPVHEEEHIFVCRRMERLLEPGQWVLDAGTGNGVYAIYAAARGCRVVAISPNPRALRIARQNALKNEITVVESLEALQEMQGQDGAIHFTLAELGKKFAHSLEQQNRFDRVILSPPYTPVCPGVSAPAHSDAGPDGQEAFKKQIRLVKKLLKAGGICVGQQLTLVERGPGETAEFRGDSVDEQEVELREGHPETEAQKEICKVFQDDGACHVHCVRIFPRDVTTESFLARQYHTYLRTGSGLPVDSNRIRVCLKKLCEGYSRFALIYYEASSQSIAGVPEVTHFSPNDARLVWEHRIQAHREVVEHTSDSGNRVIPWLFMQGAPATPEFREPEAQKDKATSRTQTFERSFLKAFDLWLRRSDLLKTRTSTRRSMFDLLYVEASPYYPLIGGQGNLLSESKPWVQRHLSIPAEFLNQGQRALHISLIEAWNRVTSQLYRANSGLWAHQHFSGATMPNQWAEILYTIRGVTSQDAETLTGIGWTDRERSRTYQRIRKVIASNLEQVKAEKYVSAPDTTPTESYNAIYLDPFNGYFSAPLAELIEEDINKNWKEVANRLSNLSLANTEEQLRENLGIDAIACHSLAHREFHDSLRKVLVADGDGIPELQWSVLISIPLSLNFSEQTGKTKFLQNYRGGIWLFAGSSDEWTLEHEQSLLDAARLLWLLCNGQYNLDAVESLEKQAAIKQAATFGHEIKRIASAVSSQWLVDPKLSVMLDEYPYKIIPFPSLLTTFGKMLALWCQIEDPRSIFDQPLPETLAELVSACWQLVKDNLKVYCCRQRNFSGGRDLDLAREIFTAVDLLWTDDPYRFQFLSELSPGAELPGPKWVTRAKAADQSWRDRNWMDFSRLLCILLNNCMTHADPWEPITVGASLVNGELTLSIRDTKDRRGEAPYVQSRGEKMALPTRRNVETNPLLAGYGGRKIVEEYVHRLEGKVILWKGGVAAGELFEAEISFPLQSFQDDE